jgi:hypothetical protein
MEIYGENQNDTFGGGMGSTMTSPFMGSAEGGCGCGVEGGYDSYLGGGLGADVLDGLFVSSTTWLARIRGVLAACSLVSIVLLIVYVFGGLSSVWVPLSAFIFLGLTVVIDGLLKYAPDKLQFLNY